MKQKKESLLSIQKSLDEIKYQESQEVGKDMSGSMDYCDDCPFAYLGKCYISQAKRLKLRACAKAYKGIKCSPATVKADKFIKQREDCAEYNEPARTFTLSRLQEEAMDIWIEEHDKTCPVHKYHKQLTEQNGGMPPCGGWCEKSLVITSASMADLASVKCECGQEDYLGEV